MAANRSGRFADTPDVTHADDGINPVPVFHERLGLKRSTLQSRMNKLGIQRPES